MRRLAAILVFTAGIGAEIIDRIAVSVETQVITKSDITQHLRTKAFIDGEQPDLSPAARRKAAERLVELSLIRREMELSRYPMPELPEARPLLEQVRKDPRFPTDTSWAQELRKYSLTEEDLLRQLHQQLTTLRFIEFRFRPGIQVPASDIADYYENKFLPQWRKQHPGETPPGIDESRAEIENVLAAEQVDDALNRWLEQTRAQSRIQYHEEAFE